MAVQTRTGRAPMSISVNKQAVYEAAEKLRNWGRWGRDDQIGTLNHVTPEDIVAAAGMINRGESFATGTDAAAGRQGKLLYADDAINMPVQAATHWDSLGHIFLDDKMYNGYDARLVDCNGLGKLGIEHARAKMAGRGVLLDVARQKGVDYLEDGYGVSNDELDRTAKAQNVEIRRGDFVIVRTGQMERCLQSGKWGGYAGGDAPGVKFENCYWCQDKQIAAICADAWGVEVRPNETKEANQPWHWVVIPAMGLTMGEMFYLKELAEDCARDKVYEFFFCGPPLVITGGTGSPINPQAIK